jgi:hypothetical protein
MAASSETLIIVGIGLYLLPTLIAAARDKTHGAAGVFQHLPRLDADRLAGRVHVGLQRRCAVTPRVTGYSSALSEIRRPLLRLTGWMPEQARHRTPT